MYPQIVVYQQNLTEWKSNAGLGSEMAVQVPAREPSWIPSTEPMLEGRPRQVYHGLDMVTYIHPHI